MKALPDGTNELPRSKLSRYQNRNFFVFDASIGVPACRPGRLNSFIPIRFAIPDFNRDSAYKFQYASFLKFESHEKNSNIIGFMTGLMMFFAVSFFPLAAYSQAGFILPDTMCISDSMQAENTSGNAATYYWNFCSANLAGIPEGENLVNTGLSNAPAFIELVNFNNIFYVFVTNYLDGTLTRLDFGNDLLNDPGSVNLGQIGGINRLEGLQIVEDNGQWYAFAVGGLGDQSSVIRLDFGNSPANSPVVTNMGNIGDLSYPIDLLLFEDNGVWVGFTVNYTTNTITRFVFENGLGNVPTGENLGNIGNLDKPCGIHAITENGQWYLFITNFNSNTLTRLDFGSSLQNSPSAVNLGGSGTLESPFDLTIIRDCEHIFGFVANHYDSELVRLDFNNDIESAPDFQNIGNIGNMYQPHGLSEIYRDNDELFFLTANINNTLTRLYYTPCDNASLTSFTGRNPPRVTYNQPGVYNVSLIIDEGLPTQEAYCQQVVAFGNPVINLGSDTTIMPGTEIQLNPGENYSQYDWSTGGNSGTLRVSQPGVYSVMVTDSNGCTATDEIVITMALYIPDFFTPNGDGINDTWEIAYFQTNTEETIEIFDRFGKRFARYRGSDPGWDGTYNGKELKADTYWYVITFDDEQNKITGYVAIVR